MQSVTAFCKKCRASWSDITRQCFNCGADLSKRKLVGNATTEEKINFLNIPSGSKIKAKTDNVGQPEMFTFIRIDGSCAILTRDRDGAKGLVRFYAPLKKVADHYELVE